MYLWCNGSTAVSKTASQGSSPWRYAMKPKLVGHHNIGTSFDLPYLGVIREQLSRHFDLTKWDPTHTYNKHDIFLAPCLGAGTANWAQRLRDQGHKVIIDKLWEPLCNQDLNKQLVSNHWFWINESLWYSFIGYDQISISPAIDKIALMPMNRPKPEREKLLTALNPWLDKIIYSYNQQHLPNDNRDNTQVHWQRYCNPTWYAETYFSLVVETLVSGPTFVTEKTFKPIAFGHPFRIFGTAGTLDYLRTQGFATFDDVFDPSYDLDGLTVESKIELIKKMVADFEETSYSESVLSQIQHNKSQFFNQKLVLDLFTNDIQHTLLSLVD